MFKINENYLKLPGSYLFSAIAKKVAAYEEANPDRQVIRLGIGSFPKLKILYPNPRLRYFQNTLLCGYSESSASSWLPLDKESVSSICIATGRCFHTPAGC